MYIMETVTIITDGTIITIPEVITTVILRTPFTEAEKAVPYPLPLMAGKLPQENLMLAQM